MFEPVTITRSTFPPVAAGAALDGNGNGFGRRRPRNGFIGDGYIAANPLNLRTEGILPFEMRVDFLCSRFGPLANLGIL